MAVKPSATFVLSYRMFMLTGKGMMTSTTEHVLGIRETFYIVKKIIIIIIII